MKKPNSLDSRTDADELVLKPQFSIDQIMQLVEHAPIAVSITDLHGIIVYTNQQFTNTTGYAPEDIIGKNHSIVSYKTTPNSIYKSLWKTIANGESWQGRLVNRRKNGERYLAEVSIAPLDSNAQTNNFYMGSHRDVSQNHMQHTELKNQNELFASVLNTVPSAVALLDSEQNVVLDNLAYKTLATDFQKEPMELVLAQLRQQLDLQPQQHVQASHFPENNAISIELTQDHQTRWFRCRFLTLEMLDDLIEDYFRPTVTLHTVVVLQEFTREQRRAEAQRIAELKHSTLQGEMLHAMQETMHAVVHQLQGPVNTMESALHMMEQRSESKSGLTPMQLAFNASENALNTIRNALPERPHEARQSVNLNQLVHEISVIETESLMKKSIELRLTLEGTLPTFNAQPARLRVALKQLVDNAIDAINSKGDHQRIIEIETRTNDDALVININDSGPGIAKPLRLKVFEPFYSTKPAHTEGSRGIGLSIVQQIVSEHQASIEFHSSKLGGCQVRLMLPRR
jgi:nitrogen fixation negative regulator NifL